MARKLLSIVGISSSQTQTGAYALILEVKGSNSRIPIIIGAYEAQAIALQLEGMKPSRPITHDLFKSFTTAFNITVLEVEISKFSEGVFYAHIICFDGTKRVAIDSRTSDAIALAVRYQCPIFCEEKVIEQSAIVSDDEDKDDKGDIFDIEDEDEDDMEVKSTASLSIAELHDLLQEMIDDENYEEASKIRDEINRRT